MHVVLEKRKYKSHKDIKEENMMLCLLDCCTA